ncbi:MAG: transporter, family, putative rane transport protein [Pseudonocardiales bacterium]|jgi:YNFM family putative membrane transporter|nr:transporter [Pseudonocardia sp.]MDT7586345.1 transporter, family, putative rane transport protein [Pseudonocardiales bacterium]MDT7658045.1 transporter, family, putative rane transport protein [Pseudonocardiales bacterium]MDT7680847.1 transporter, family, putative rane transport protein [Pseudonocardiales bacterium]
MGTISAPATGEVVGHERGTPGYRRLAAALWCAGLATFVLVYCVQGLLPTLAVQFRVSSSTSSLALSATTLGLALAVVPLAAIAESWGRAKVMTWALATSAVLGLIAPLAPNFGILVGVRALQGVALAALPALAMSHVTREVAPRWLGGAMGMLIAGNTLGGLSGRLIAGAVADVGGWRLALAVIGVLSLICTVVFSLLLPPSLAAAPPRVRLRELGGPLRTHLADPGLLCLYGIGFLLMGAFVTVYNYLGFRLIAAPFDLPVPLAGLIFFAYLAGTWASTTAGRLSDRLGRRRMLWATTLVAVAGIWVTEPAWLPTVIVGLVLVTVGFFGGHSIASSWVGRRASLLPGGSPGQASALYLFAYYLGSSIGGTLGGTAYDHAGWTGLASYVTVLLAGAIALGLALRRIPSRLPA